jgi:pyruvate formate lyase activating enzyme
MERNVREALLWKQAEGQHVDCFLCEQRCHIAPGKRGVCQVRENREGTLYTLVYGYAIAHNVDPIEKKPLFHFYPGSTSLSIATVGCNFRCLHCQNADISQLPRDGGGRIVGEWFPPEAVIAAAKRAGSRSISYTYTEPTIFMEYAYDAAKLAHENGLLNNFVTNGYMTPEALDLIDGYLDAANVDLKSFSDDFSRKVCGARLQGVLQALRVMKEKGVWVEVTTLVIPGMNDSEAELKQIAEFVHSLGPETPWHVTAFHPTYRMTERPRTQVESLRRARQIGLEAGLRYVYSGNVPGDQGENTFCHHCGKEIIGRLGFTITERHVRNGACEFCSTPVAGIGMSE